MRASRMAVALFGGKFCLVRQPQGGGGDEQAGDAEREAKVEVAPVPSQQGDGGEDDGDLQERFSEIVAGGLALGVFDLVLQCVGLGLIVVELGGPLGDLGL